MRPPLHQRGPGMFDAQAPAPQIAEAAIQGNLGGGTLLNPGGLAQAHTTSRSSRMYSGGGLTPQNYERQQAGPGTPEQLADVPRTMNARQALSRNRGMGPRFGSPLKRKA